MANEALLHFAKEIGWRENILSTPATLSEEWVQRLDELLDLHRRPATWSSDAVGTLEYPENGEQWMAEYRTFIDGKRIWRLYERVHPNPERPRFRIARRSPEMTWETMGYFDKWPECWESNRGANATLRKLAGFLNPRGRIGKN